MPKLHRLAALAAVLLTLVFAAQEAGEAFGQIAGARIERPQRREITRQLIGDQLV